MSKGLTASLLLLIPKVMGPERFTPLRPISLCNVLYKLVTKTIINRSKPLLPTLIAPTQ